MRGAVRGQISASPIFPDLAKAVVPDRPNQLWVADLTYVAIPGGFVYLAAILDDPVVDSHPEWERYPARLADLVAEERQRRADFQAHLAQAQEGPDQP